MVARCKPLTKDHLPLKTAFAGTKGWLVVTCLSLHSVCFISSCLTSHLLFLSFHFSYHPSCINSSLNLSSSFNGYHPCDAIYPYVSLVLIAFISFEENARKLVLEFRSPYC